VFGRAGDKHLIAGGLGLSLRAMRTGSMRLEVAVPSLAAILWWVRCKRRVS
jgi:hypothetical protein